METNKKEVTLSEGRKFFRFAPGDEVVIKFKCDTFIDLGIDFRKFNLKPDGEYEPV